MVQNKAVNIPAKPDKTAGVGRKELKEKFENGKIPADKDFALLIDSMVNELDDGFKKDEQDGFIFIPPPDSDKILSIRKKIDEKETFFSIEKDKKKIPVIKPGAVIPINRAALNEDEGYLRINPEGAADTGKSFYFHKNGKLGIGKTCGDSYKMEVDGFLAMKGRIGTYEPELPAKDEQVIDDPARSRYVPADGKWYPIIEGLDNCNAFEIVARCGKVYQTVKTGKFALLHAIAVSSFGKSHSRIRKTSSHYGSFWNFGWWNKINLKWHGDTHRYSLLMKTNSHYGKDEKIFYRITKLWDDKLFTEDSYYYKEK